MHNIDKKSFYVYATLLVVMHILNLIGDSLVFADIIEVGFWYAPEANGLMRRYSKSRLCSFIDTSVIMYYTLFPPVLYFSFLWEFFHADNQSKPLFDEMEYEQIN